MIPSSEDRILRFLKFRGAQRTEAVARHLGISPTGARKQLSALSDAGLLAWSDEAGAVGRPKRYWRLAEKAEARFPDSHAVLTLEMIAAVRGIFGADGLDRLIAEREEKTLARYREAIRPAAGLEGKLDALARLRSEEGYMAEWSRLGDGTYLLAENHCPICAAARSCQGFCRSELDVFSRLFGDDVRVERSEHILAGARRCAYRIVPGSVPA